MNKKKLLLCFSIFGYFSVFSSTGVYAENVLSVDKPELIQSGSNISGKLDSYIENQGNKINVDLSELEKDKNSSSSSDEELSFMTGSEILGNQDVGIEDFGNLIISRLLDVVSFFQKFARPFTIIMFILSALLSLISMVFDTGKVKTGLLGMMLSILAYVGVMYAPDLVMFFAQWLSV